jgi:hypothetical protein
LRKTGKFVCILLKIIEGCNFSNIATDAGNILLEVLCVNCANQQEALQDTDVVHVGAGSNLNNVLANGIKLVAEAVNVLLDLLGLGMDERRL